MSENPKKSLSEELINSIKATIPSGTNIANLLSDILFLGKDAIYRRLRGEVSFTLEELALIARKLNISLDNTIGLRDTSKTVFSLKIPDSANVFEDYCKILKDYTLFYQRLNEHPNQKICKACNTISLMLYSPYENLSKFKVFKWITQTQISKATLTFSEIEFPQKMKDSLKEYLTEVRKIESLEILWDKNVFISLAKEVIYFYKLDLISATDLITLKDEILDLISTWENIATSGNYPKTDQKISIYLSDLNFEATYMYHECEGFQFSDISIYSIGSLNTYSPLISKAQKSWIDSLKRFSTLISCSNEIERREFFKSQRNAISKIMEIPQQQIFY